MTNSGNQKRGSGYYELNPSRSIGIVADLGGYAHGNRQTLSYLFGLRVEPADVALHAVRSVPVGCGLDIDLTHHVAFKPFQVEYFMTVPQLATNLNSVQNNLRASAGFVYRFGGR